MSTPELNRHDFECVYIDRVARKIWCTSPHSKLEIIISYSLDEFQSVKATRFNNATLEPVHVSLTENEINECELYFNEYQKENL